MSNYTMQDVFSRMTNLCARLKMPFETERPYSPGAYWLLWIKDDAKAALYRQGPNDSAELISGTTFTRRQYCEMVNFMNQMLHESYRVALRAPAPSQVIAPAAEIINAMRNEIDREPTADELADFMRYAEVDIYEWLRTSARCWATDRKIVAKGV